MLKSEASQQIIALQRKRNIEVARERFEAISSELPLAEVQEILGNFAFYERRFRDAISHFESAISESPNYTIAAYYYLIGFNRANEGNFEEAIKHLTYAIEVDPTFVEPYVELGYVLMRIKHFSGAVQCYEDAIKVDPNDFANYHNLVQALMQLENSEPGVHGVKLQQAIVEYDLAKERLGAPNEAFRWNVDD